MTNLQLLLSIGIPSVLIVLGWLSQSQRLTALRESVRGDINGLRDEMKDLRGEMISLRDQMHADMVVLHDASPWLRASAPRRIVHTSWPEFRGAFRTFRSA